MDGGGRAQLNETSGSASSPKGKAAWSRMAGVWDTVAASPRRRMKGHHVAVGKLSRATLDVRRFESLSDMYHVELRQFPHNCCRFNLTEQQLREAILDAWARGNWIELG